MEIKKVFGQNEITSVNTYFERVNKENFGELTIRVAGPIFYHNEMTIDYYNEQELIEAFQQRDEHEPVDSLESLAGHSLIAYYQHGRLIGFQGR